MLANLTMVFLFLGSFLYAFFRGPKKGFFNLYLPFLLLIPTSLMSDIPGLPDTNTGQTVILGITAACFLSLFSKIRIGFIEILLFAFVSINITSEFFSEIEPEPRGEILYSVTDILLPYFFAKIFVGMAEESTNFSKRIVWLVFLCALTFPYEIRMTASPIFQVLDKIYGLPDEGALVLRYGLRRFTGPWVHAILAGITLSTAILLHLWMMRNKLWQKKSFILLIFMLVVLSLAEIVTFARAPLYSLILALTIASVGYSKHRMRSLILGFGGFIVAGLFIYLLVSPYFAENRTITLNEDWNTFTYRLNLITDYFDKSLQRPFLGWGNYGWTSSRGHYISVDNQYLWLGLRHGYIAVSLLITILLYAMLRLFKKGMTLPISNHYERSLCFTLLAILFMMTLSFATVYIGGQTSSLLFMILGWSQGLLYQMRKKRV